MQFYTYAHYKPQGGLFYIGKGHANRAYNTKDRNIHWRRVVAKYGKPHVEILANWNTEKEALDHEKLLITSFKEMGFVLANITDGGEGCTGLRHTEEVKQRIRMLNTGRKATPEQIEKLRLAGLNRKHTPETLAKMSIAQKGNTNGKGNFGSKRSEETKKKLSIAKTGTKMSYEHRAIISATHKGKKQSPEQIKKRIASRLATIEARKNERKVTS
jgi:hypothetical protein